MCFGIGLFSIDSCSLCLVYRHLLNFFADNSEKAFYKELVKVIEASDVILEVLDARDPLGTRCVDMEKMVMSSGPDKRLVLLLNKIGMLHLWVLIFLIMVIFFLSHQ